MKDNKNQPAVSFPAEELNTSPKLAKVLPMNNRYETSKKAPVHVQEEKSKIIRRYSFDDNGGGYLGL